MLLSNLLVFRYIEISTLLSSSKAEIAMGDNFEEKHSIYQKLLYLGVEHVL